MIITLCSSCVKSRFSKKSYICRTTLKNSLFRLSWPQAKFMILMRVFIAEYSCICNSTSFPLKYVRAVLERLGKVARVIPSFLTSTGTLVMFKSSMSSCQRLESCPSSIGSSWIPGLLQRQEGLKSSYWSLNKTSLHPVNFWSRKERRICLFGTAH